MDLHQLRYALLKVTLVILFGSSWVFWSFIFATRPENTAVDPINQLVRLPASLPSQIPTQLPRVFQAASRAPEAVRMDSVQVPCWDRSAPTDYHMDAKWVRITGGACQTDVPADQITLENTANGYLGTVFSMGQGALTSDYIPLQEGKNEIQLRFKPTAGAVIENRITIQRR